MDRIRHISDRLKYIFHRDKTIVLLLCPMRSGSTLLKALLARAPDVSHLPEVQFRRFHAPSDYSFYIKASSCAEEPIIVLKHPFWFASSSYHWRIPELAEIKPVLLVRDCAPLCTSLEQMLEKTGNQIKTDERLIEYWCNVGEYLLSVRDNHDNVAFVRYEDLTEFPERITKGLFDFIGSSQRKGVRSYHKPEKFEWEWGSDDGGDHIRTLEVSQNIRKSKESLV